MKVIVFAYHDMGCAGIKALIKSGYTILSVFTHRDEQHENIFFDSVSTLAINQGIPVYYPENINDSGWIAHIRSMNAEAIFCLSFRQELCEEILGSVPLGAFNIHASLLPRYRGRAHLNWVIIKGETETGVTLHRMTQVPDAGPILAQSRVPIEPDDDALTLHRKLVKTTEQELLRWLPALSANHLIEHPQDERQASCFGQRKPEDGTIDWSHSATDIANLVRGVSYPWPGANTSLEGRNVIIWQCRVVSHHTALSPGVVYSTEPLIIACGKGAIEVLYGESVDHNKMSGIQLANRLNLKPGMTIR